MQWSQGSVGAMVSSNHPLSNESEMQAIISGIVVYSSHRSFFYVLNCLFCEVLFSFLFIRLTVESSREDCVLTWVPFSMKLRLADDGTLVCLDLVRSVYMHMILCGV